MKLKRRSSDGSRPMIINNPQPPASTSVAFIILQQSLLHMILLFLQLIHSEVVSI